MKERSREGMNMLNREENTECMHVVHVGDLWICVEYIVGEIYSGERIGDKRCN
jgi:hypothetical protein